MYKKTKGSNCASLDLFNIGFFILKEKKRNITLNAGGETPPLRYPKVKQQQILYSHRDVEGAIPYNVRLICASR